MTIIDKVKNALATVTAKWRSFGQIAPLAAGFIAGLGTTLIL